MPGLILFRRRWAIGSDDFVFPCLGEAIFRFAWLVTLAIIFGVHHNGFSCDYGNELKAFYIGTLVLNSLAICQLIALIRISMQGTITYSWPRRYISRWLYAKLFLLPLEAVWVCLSTYWAFGHSYTCDRSVVWTARGAVICSWIVGFILFVGILIIFDPMGSVNQRQSISCSMSQGQMHRLSVTSMTSTQVWEKRCRVLCCCVACNPDTQQAFTDISKLVAEYFHDLDLVPTDIAAGLMLVHQQQAYQESRISAHSNTGLPSEGTSVQQEPDDIFPEPKSWMTIPNMAHFMKFAQGSYGWPFFIYENLATGVCRLCPQFRFCACIRSPNAVIGDNICQCNTAAIKKLSGINDDDLIYVSFENRFKKVPYFVTVDRSTYSVVISIRGTLSFNDALADLSARGAPLEIFGLEDSYCHEAILDCAKSILADLESLRILDTAFAQLETEGKLVITGHSLGAGVAAVLSVLLRPKYPDLICFSYSPPGGLMSKNASRYTQDFVCSVVVGKDLVPRLGMYTLIDLKVKLLRALCQCNQPKYKILATGCLNLVCCLKPSDTPVTRKGSQPREIDEERFSILQGNTLQDTLRSAELQLEQTVTSSWPMHPAGQILHVVELNDSYSSPTYGAFWSRPEYFNHIVISPKMMSDHIPGLVYNALEQLANRNYVPQSQEITQQTC